MLSAHWDFLIVESEHVSDVSPSEQDGETSLDAFVLHDCTGEVSELCEHSIISITKLNLY